MKNNRTSTDATKRPAVQQSLSTGINGLDEILGGGLAPGTFTAVRGASGTGKTLFSLSFASDTSDGGAGVFVSFEENVANLQSHLSRIKSDGKVHFLDMHPSFDEIQVSGGFELGGLLVRIEHAVKKTGATRLVLDGVDCLFETYNNPSQVRADFGRLMAWASDQKLTIVGTFGEDSTYREATSITDYLAHCVIRLQQQVEAGVMSRLLRVVKFRGRGHGTDQYPYVIHKGGISVMPITSTNMTTTPSIERLSTGNERLDYLLGGGIWKGSATMISGRSGAGKSLLAISIAGSLAKRGRKVLYMTLEESPGDIIRDAKSIGIDLAALIKKDRFHPYSRRAVQSGLEEHIISLVELQAEQGADVVVIDPMSALRDIGDGRAAKSMILRLANHLRNKGATVIMTELIQDSSDGFSTLNISSLVDTWIRLRQEESDGELNRLVHVQKSRGSATSKQVYEFRISDDGIEIEAPYVGPSGMVFGTRKAVQEAEDDEEVRRIRSEIKGLKKLMDHERSLVEFEKSTRSKEVEIKTLRLMSQVDDLEARLTAIEAIRSRSDSLRKG